MEWVLWICVATAAGCSKELITKTASEAACRQQLASVRIQPGATVTGTWVELAQQPVVVAACIQRVKK